MTSDPTAAARQALTAAEAALTAARQALDAAGTATSELTPTLLTVAEAAARLRVSRSHLYGMLGTPDGPPSVMLGGRRLIPTAALDDWLDSRLGQAS